MHADALPQTMISDPLKAAEICNIALYGLSLPSMLGKKGSFFIRVRIDYIGKKTLYSDRFES